jgi:hypothetical protein
MYLIYKIFLADGFSAKLRDLSRARSGAPTAGSVSGSSMPPNRRIGMIKYA